VGVTGADVTQLNHDLANLGYLNAATAREPVAVLGYEATQLLGIDRIWPGMRIWVGGQWFSVAGILNSATLAQQLDTTGPGRLPRRTEYLGFDHGQRQHRRHCRRQLGQRLA
jgi:putative ABC transport system permease protein